MTDKPHPECPLTPPDSAWYGRMEQKLDIVVERSVDHEERLRGLEKARNWILGAGAAMGAALGALFKIKGQ